MIQVSNGHFLQEAFLDTLLRINLYLLCTPGCLVYNESQDFS